jgi:hypothetical protein
MICGHRTLIRKPEWKRQHKKNRENFILRTKLIAVLVIRNLKLASIGMKCVCVIKMCIRAINGPI